MPKLSPIVTLDKTLSELLKKRQEHQAALAEIDAVFAKFGISPRKDQPVAAKALAATPAQPATKRRRKRGQFAETAEEFVLGLLKGKSLQSSQINSAWKQSGRKNTADNTLTLLVKKKAIKRTPLKEGRGSNYSVA